MAVKNITKSGTHNITINKNSKDMTYSVSPKIAAGTYLKLDVQNEGTIVYKRQGDNLIVNFAFDITSYNPKQVKIIIKDYYKCYDENNYFLAIKSSIITPTSIANACALVDYAEGDYQNTKVTGILGDKGSTKYNLTTQKTTEYIADYFGNDIYNIQSKYTLDNSKATIKDTSGNDKYTVGETIANIDDFRGNDNYVLEQDSISRITDRGGNDSYTFKHSGDTSVVDNSGNDKYDIYKNNDKLVINDKKGKDKYNIYDTNSTLTICDYEGNDSYNIKLTRFSFDLIDKNGNDKYIAKGLLSTSTIKDYTGNDSYNIQGTNSFVYIYDGYDADLGDADNEQIRDKSGNDIYSISRVDSIVSIKDTAGTETYNISDVDSGVIIEDGYLNSTKGGSDKYNIKGIYDGVEIIDYYGSEKYNLSLMRNGAVVTEYKGNDTYNFKSFSSGANIYDFEGTDKYNISDINDQLYIIDGGNSISHAEIINNLSTSKSGSDKYNISKVLGATNIYDYTGNETYNISTADDAKIYDYSGNDNYKLSDISYDTQIIDFSGNDKYNASNTAYTTIVDLKGSETYNLSYTSGTLKISDGCDPKNFINSPSLTNIFDAEKSGSDKYIISHMVYDSGSVGFIEDAWGEEKYYLNDITDLKITDRQGADSYVINKAKEITILDGKNGESVSKNDKYALSNIAKLTLTDYDGDDTYSVNNIYKTSGTNSIDDKTGKDKYNIANSNITIIDRGNDDDIYTIKKLDNKVIIDDEGGSYDKLTISTANKNNLIYMADFNSYSQLSDKQVNSGDLFIFDKTTLGCVKIENFYNTYSVGDEREYIETDLNYMLNSGSIETIIAGKKNITTDTINFATDANLAAVAEVAGSWLWNNKSTFESVTDLFNDGSKDEIQDFLVYCNNNI